MYVLCLVEALGGSTLIVVVVVVIAVIARHSEVLSPFSGIPNEH